MFKGKFVKITIIAAAIVLVAAALCIGLTGCATPKPQGTTTIVFGSDSHVSQSVEDLKKAVNKMYKLDKDLDAIAIVGDLVDNGTISEYLLFESTLRSEMKEETVFTACMGNHEWYKLGWGVDIAANGLTNEIRDEFQFYIGCKPESDVEVNGIHIIAVSPDNELDSYSSHEEYLKERIQNAAKENPDRPIFLICHKNVAHTVITTWFEGKEGALGFAPDWSQDFLDFMAEYPQLIYISGHTHNSVKDALSIYQDDYTHVNDGCMLNGEFLYTEISENNVVTIHRIDYLANEEVGEPWVIDIPAIKKDKANMKYTTEARYDASATLQFESDELVIEEVTPESVTVTYPTVAEAKDDVECNYLSSYIFTITEKATGKKIDTNGVSDQWVEGHYRIFADEYYGKMNSTNTTFEGLTPDTEYTIEVYPLNPLFKPGETISAEFKTPAA